MNAAGSELWAAVDWGDQSHTVCIVDADGKQVTSFTVKHEAEQLEKMVLEIKQHGPISGVAVETNHGLLILKLLDANLTVYAVNPQALRPVASRPLSGGSEKRPGRQLHAGRRPENAPRACASASAR